MLEEGHNCHYKNWNYKIGIDLVISEHRMKYLILKHKGALKLILNRVRGTIKRYLHL